MTNKTYYKETKHTLLNGRNASLKVPEKKLLAACNPIIDIEKGSEEDDGGDPFKSYDAVVFDILKVSAEDIANQLTLLDIEIFKAILPDELASCSWNKKDKHQVCPNVVAFTRRFNHTSFWVVKEVLNNNTIKIRAEIISHFIKIAKKLLDLNNLHSMKAVISGLQCAPVHRLEKSWAFIERKDKAKFDKMDELVSEENNRQNLRNYLDAVRLPCIPYLGMYMTDLTYIDTAHPSSGGLDDKRSQKMNNIFRVISEFQQSEYDFIESVPHIQSYLSSSKYIDELQKFMEDDYYKTSLSLEPLPSRAARASVPVAQSSSRGSLQDVSLQRNGHSPMFACFRPPSVRSNPGGAFIPRHRKSQSLGWNFVQSTNDSSIDSLSCNGSLEGSRHLLDDSVIPSLVPKAMSSDSMFDSDDDMCRINHFGLDISLNSSSDQSPLHGAEDVHFTFEGILRRKKCLRNGRKPTVSAWHRFWVGLNGSCMYYYSNKHRSLQDRSAFKRTASKVVNIHGWLVVLLMDPHHPDMFQLSDEENGNMYKFHAGSQKNALLWHKYLSEAANVTPGNVVPRNLITFEESYEPEDTKF